MSSKILTIIVVIVVLVGGFFLLNGNKEASLIDNSGDELVKDNENEEGDSLFVPAPGSEGVVDEMVVNTDGVMTENYEGEILTSGNAGIVLDFNRNDYEEAIAGDKLVVLYFYANWCPICRAEFPKMLNAFEKLDGDEVIGFRVNFNDDETDDYEKGLAREFGVAYQHTKVFVKDGVRILKAPDSWEESRYISEVNSKR